MKIIQKIEDSFLVFRRAMTEQLFIEAKGLGLSLSHFEVIMSIAHGGPKTMKDISKILHITPPSASTLIDVLVKKNFVKRVNIDNDRRTVHIALTDKAQKIITLLYKKKVSIFKKMLSSLNEEDEINLIRILNKLTVK